MGIDKEAVAKKVGNAALVGGKYAWEGLKSVDYAKAWENTKTFTNNVIEANNDASKKKK